MMVKMPDEITETLLVAMISVHWWEASWGSCPCSSKTNFYCLACQHYLLHSKTSSGPELKLAETKTALQCELASSTNWKKNVKNGAMMSLYRLLVLQQAFIQKKVNL